MLREETQRQELGDACLGSCHVRKRGAEDAERGIHLADEGHGYEFSKRKPVYRFFAKHLKLRLSQITGDDDEITEKFFKPLPKEKLIVFTEEHPRPKHSLDGSEACLAALRKAQGKP